MSLSQAVLDRMARSGQRMYGALQEEVTYHHKATAAAPTETVQLRLVMGSYRASQIDGEVILRTDQRARVASAAIAFTPLLYDELVRDDGSVWRVMFPEGGPGDPWWFLQCRKVG